MRSGAWTMEREASRFLFRPTSTRTGRSEGREGSAGADGARSRKGRGRVRVIVCAAHASGQPELGRDVPLSYKDARRVVSDCSGAARGGLGLGELCGGGPLQHYDSGRALSDSVAKLVRRPAGHTYSTATTFDCGGERRRGERGVLQSA